MLPVSQETAEIFMKDDPDRRVTVTGGGTGVGDFRPDGQHDRYRYGFPSHQIQRKDETGKPPNRSGGGNHSVCRRGRASALLRAQRALSDDMTNLPSYRKGEPGRCAGAADLAAFSSLAPSDLQDYAEHLISPTLSTLNGVAQVNIFGAKRYAVRVRVQPDALAARKPGLTKWLPPWRAATSTRCWVWWPQETRFCP